MKFDKRTTFAAIAVLITFVFCVPFYFSNVFGGLDITFHLSRIEGLLSSMRDLQLPWAIYPEKNFGFGYASPLFYCDLFLFPASILYALHVPIIIVYKIYVAVIVLIGVYLALYAMDYFTDNLWMTIFGALVFTFSAYHINDVFIRAAFGEAMAYSLMPLFPVYMHQFLVQRRNRPVALGLYFALLAVCHLITFSLCAAVFALLIIIYFPRVIKNRGILTLLGAVCIGFALSAFFLVPLVQQLGSQKFLFAQNRELFGESIMKMYSNTILSAFSDFTFELGYNLESHHYYNGLLIILCPFIFLMAEKKDETFRLFAVLTAISVVLFVCTTNLIPLWKIPFLQSIQFTYRFNILIASFLPFAMIYALNSMNRRKAVTISAVMCAYMVLNTAIIDVYLLREGIRIDNFAGHYTLFTGKFYENYNNHYNVAELSSGEYLPATHHMDYEEQQASVYLFDTVAPSVNYERTGTRSVLKLDALNDGFVAIPVSWYLGYQAERIEPDGSKTIIPITQEEYTGRIVIPVITGTYEYHVRYIGTKMQKIALAFSSVSVLILIGFLMVKKARSEDAAGE